MPDIYWLKCRSNHWSRSVGIKGVKNCQQPPCTAAKVKHFKDVLEGDDFSVHKAPTATVAPNSIKDFKVASTDPYTKHQCGAPSVKNYRAILAEIGAANSIMRIASDACVEYMDKLKAADAGAFGNLLIHLNKGSGFFNNLARDVQMALLRESRGHVEVNMGYVEENVWLEYRSTQLSTYYVTQAGTYDNVNTKLKNLIEMAKSITEKEAADFLTALDSKTVADAIDVKDLPDEYKRRLKMFFAVHSFLLRALEPARRRAAGPLNALAQELWRQSMVTRDEVVPRAAAYGIMAHQGASGKTETADESDENRAGKIERKTKTIALLKKLLDVTSDGAVSVIHQRSGGKYDLKELANAVMFWLDGFDASGDRDGYQKVAVRLEETTTTRGKKKKVATGIEVHYVNASTVRDKDYYEAKDGHAVEEQQNYFAVCRFYLRKEGPEMTGMAPATENLKKLFVGLMISENQRWV